MCELVVPETSFFRHREQFDAFTTKILPELIERRTSESTLRIWSAACSIGAEPASLAVLLESRFAHRLAGWSVRILATDLSREHVRRTAEQIYAERELRGLSRAELAFGFEEAADRFHLRESCRRLIEARAHNLLDEAHPDGPCGAPFDVILCRNALIYFDQTGIRAVLERLHRRLAADGYLVVGHGEPLLSYSDLFRAELVGGTYVYRRADSRAYAPPPVVPGFVWPSWPEPELLPTATRETNPGKAAPTAPELDPAIHFDTALQHVLAGRRDEAETELRRCLYLDRRHAMARFHLSQLLMARGKNAAALRELRNTLALYDGVEDEQLASATDGLTVGSLRELAAMQMESIGAAA